MITAGSTVYRSIATLETQVVALQSKDLATVAAAVGAKLAQTYTGSHARRSAPVVLLQFAQE